MKVPVLKISEARKAARALFDAPLAEMGFCRSKALNYVRPVGDDGLLQGFVIDLAKGAIIHVQPDLTIQHKGICRVYERFSLPYYPKIVLEKYHKFSDIVTGAQLRWIVDRNTDRRLPGSYIVCSADDIPPVCRAILQDFIQVHEKFYADKSDFDSLALWLKASSGGGRSTFMLLSLYFYLGRTQDLVAYVDELESGPWPGIREIGFVVDMLEAL